MRSLIVSCVLFAVTCWASATQAQGSGATVLNFSCDGTMEDTLTGEKDNPIHNLGLVVNLVERTVSFASYVAPFKKVDAANISFYGVNQGDLGLSNTIGGNIDRVTGAIDATIFSTVKSTLMNTEYWDLLCKPTTRLF